MKLTILTLALVVLAGIPQIAKAMDTHAQSGEMSKPVVTAVAFHSDNCGSCKILGPKMMKAMGAINKDKISVVKFNFTDKETIAATKTLAASKGVNDVLQQYGAKTGFVVLLNAEGEEVDKLTVNDSTADIAAKMAKAIASAS